MLFLPVIIVKGLEKSSREPLTVAFAAVQDHNIDYWAGLIFEEGYKQHHLGRCFAGKIQTFLKQNHPDCGLALIRHNALSQSFLPARGLRIPNWVEMSLDISLPNEKLFGNQRTYLKGKIKKYGLTYTMTKDRKAFDDFYHHMFLPYIQQRHGPKALMGSYEELLKTLKKGALILVNKGQEIISGGLMELTGGQARFRRLGVRNGDFKYVKEGAIGSLYYFLVLEMKQRGYKKLLIGGTRPFLTNGVTQFKTALGAQLIKEGPYSCVFAAFLKPSRPLKQFLANNPFIFIDQNGQPCCAFFSESHEGAKVDEAAKDAQHLGCGFRIFTDIS